MSPLNPLISKDLMVMAFIFLLYGVIKNPNHEKSPFICQKLDRQFNLSRIIDFESKYLSSFGTSDLAPPKRALNRLVFLYLKGII